MQAGLKQLLTSGRIFVFFNEYILKYVFKKDDKQGTRSLKRRVASSERTRQLRYSLLLFSFF
ncbi:hypothetical protein SAMN05421736_12520 [Evansella caseinilytica]|uniref:Uncharacterized protein n=1 Tax=Evansella caseinilytica TaxID=1503961 RepID=A0A1H3US24_9BACI|nr:hypothetical protein SAMN05421736_12520 [Evansella caseinilytica]